MRVSQGAIEEDCHCPPLAFPQVDICALICTHMRTLLHIHIHFLNKKIIRIINNEEIMLRASYIFFFFMITLKARSLLLESIQ